MTINVAINGFGRIGRCILRAVVDSGRDDLNVVAINDLTNPATLLHLLQFDSVHGRFNADVTLSDDGIVLNGKPIRMSAVRTPQDLEWQDVDIALECTGYFTSRDKAAAHLENGSNRVLVSAPGSRADKTVVYGVNHQDLTKDDTIVSNASCTTNCLAPVAKVLNDSIGITTGYMTTVHAYTGDQPTHDSPHSDLHRARAAALSMIPTTTGAARALSLVLPELEGKIEGSALRVPTANVSMIDLCFTPERATSVEEINAIMQKSAKGELAGVLGYDDRPLVSVDFNHDPHSATFDAGQTSVTDGGLVRVVAWYDNEWGFSNRMIDTAAHMAAMT